MTIGLILILSILLLGGLLATLGDRLGTRVGKARLSLFGLRPRQTAVLVTIVTGTLISGSTLGILFAMSQPLRRGIFEYDETQRKLREARRELQSTQAQKAQIEIELAQVRSERELVQQNLDNLNAGLQTIIAQKSATEETLEKTQAQLQQVATNFQQTQMQLTEVMGKFQQAQRQLAQVAEQTENLQAELQKLRAERQALIRQQEEVKTQISERDQEIAQRNVLITERDRVIAQREARLKALEDQQQFLERQVRLFEQYYQDYQDLRQGNLALLRGQILASAVIEVFDPQGSLQAVDRLLMIANNFAREQVKPGTGTTNEQVIQVTADQVKQLREQIENGQEYVVRVLSAGNYIRGETNVEIFADVVLNQVVFEAGEAIATNIVNSTLMSEQELLEQLGILIESSRFRARRGGILGNSVQVADGLPETLLNFVRKIQATSGAVTIQAVADQQTYTAGPLIIDLIAFQNGQELFRTVQSGGEIPN